MRIGVLASGQGSILNALIEEGLPVAVVVVDRPCGAETVAARHGVESVLIERVRYDSSFDRDAYTSRLIEALELHKVDLIAMAGFLTIVSPELSERWPGRVLNTHPALLPAFAGLYGSQVIKAALESGVPETGCTVHVVTAEVDAGPVLAQESVAVLPGDTVESLHERIKVVERTLYPKTIKEMFG